MDVYGNHGYLWICMDIYGMNIYGYLWMSIETLTFIHLPSAFPPPCPIWFTVVLGVSSVACESPDHSEFCTVPPFFSLKIHGPAHILAAQSFPRAPEIDDFSGLGRILGHIGATRPFKSDFSWILAASWARSGEPWAAVFQIF